MPKIIKVNGQIDDGNNVLEIVGMGGVGKTVLTSKCVGDLLFEGLIRLAFWQEVRKTKKNLKKN